MPPPPLPILATISYHSPHLIFWVSTTNCALFLLYCQVLGGVSEEQATEAAHQQSQKQEEEKEMVEDGKDDDSDGGVEAMEDDEQVKGACRPSFSLFHLSCSCLLDVV